MGIGLVKSDLDYILKGQILFRDLAGVIPLKLLSQHCQDYFLQHLLPCI